MSSATAIDFQIANTTNLEKIERFMSASVYQQNLEYSANFNTRLCVERRLRLPFFEPQTGVAQNHCSLFMTRRQRMPGCREGQLYSYPAARWRKHGRQYLTKMLRPFGGLPSATSTSNSGNSNHIIHRRIEPVANDVDSDFNGSVSFLDESRSSLGGGAGDTSDSKDSQNLKEELPREWFYEDMDLNEIEALDEPTSPVDDEYDYDPRYGAKKRKKRGKGGTAPKTRTSHASEGSRKGRPPGGGVTGGRGRRRKTTRSNAHKVESPSPRFPEPPSFETAAAAVEKYF